MSLLVKELRKEKRKSRTKNIKSTSALKHTYYFKKLTSKRVVDVLLACMNMVSLMILFPFIYLGIKCSSRGPVIFKQQRTGQFGLPFTCYKFRTMHIVDENYKEKDEDSVTVTEMRDPRIFWFGSLLRKTNLDELPQIINILKGDMSFVGPRPYEVGECDFWNQQLDDYSVRYRVKPGLSGLAQVQGHRGGTRDLKKMRQRLDCDIWYVENLSFMLDLKIIFKTVKQMIYLDTNAH